MSTTAKITVLCLGLAFWLTGPMGQSESVCLACPMCKTATETAGTDNQPRAYMASILTMLSMPALLFTVLGIAMYRLSLQEEQALREWDPPASQENSSPTDRDA